MIASGRLREVWLNASSREQLLLALGALVVVGGLAFAFAWQPLTGALAATDVSLREARERTVAAQHAADEIAGLARTPKLPRTADLRVAVERVVAAQGLRGSPLALELQEGRLRLTFAAIDFDALAALLDALGREEQLFAVEALLAARVVPGTVRADLVLARPPAR